MMKIILKRQTTWGCVRHFIVYKNGVKQGRLFNNITTEIEAEIGDILEFREGLFHFSQKIKVSSDTKEITISNTNQIKRLFSLFIMLFIAISLLSLSITSLKMFLFTEVSAFILLNHLFRYRSYNFNIKPMDSLISDVSGVEIY